MYKLLILIHVIAGIAALISGAIAIFSKKGRKNHNKSGLVYEYAMYTTTIFATIGTLIKFNPFFLAIGIFSFYLVYSGRYALRRWQTKANYKITKLEWIKTFFFLIVALYMVGWPLYKMIIAQKLFFSVMQVFGLIMLSGVMQDFKNLKNETLVQPKQKYWLLRHIGMMSGSYIAAFTAFAVNNMIFEQGWIMWILPTIVGSILISSATRKWKKKLGIVAAIFLFPMFSIGQNANLNSISGFVLNQDSIPVAFANIGVKGSAIGTVSDEKGRFELFFPKGALQNKSLSISHIAYENREFEVNKIDGKNTKIFLEAKAVELKEVVIQVKGWQEKTYGFNKTFTFLKNNLAIKDYPNQNLGSAVGRKFSLGTKEHKIEKIKFYVNQNNFDTALMRISVTKVENGTPSKPLHEEPFLLELRNKTEGWITLNISEKNVYANSDVAVTIEWIKQSKNGNYLSFPITMPVPGVTHYYRFGSQNDWKVYPTMTTAIQLVTLKEKS